MARVRAAAVGVVLALSVASCAHGPGPATPTVRPMATRSPILVKGTWASVAGDQVGVYFILSNRGATADSLTGASSPAAGDAILKHGSMTVRRLKLPAGSHTSFGGSWRIELTGLRRPIESGDALRVTLMFAHARAITFVAGVR